MKNIAKLAVKSVFGSIDPLRRDNSFEVILIIRFLVLTI